MNARLLVLSTFAFVTLTFAAGCDFLVEGVGLEALSTADSTPIDTSDPVIKAATEAQHTVDAITEADQLLDRGLSSGELQPIKDASARRPNDPRYADYLQAMEIALNIDTDHRSGFERATKALGASQSSTRYRTAREVNKPFVDALLDTRSHFPPDSEQWKRLSNYYCFYLKEYEREQREILESPRIGC